MSKRTLDNSTVAASCTKIAKRHRRRLNEPGKETYTSPTTNAAGDLRIRAYKLGRKLKGRKDLGALGLDPFFLVLLRVFGELRMTTKNDRNRARLIAKELQYADEHNVPPKYLIGSIHQAGGRKGIERLRAAPVGTSATSSSKKRERHNVDAKHSRDHAITPRRRRDKNSTASPQRTSRRKWRKS